MKIKYFLQLIILFLGIFWITPSFASISSEESTIWANNKGEEILNILTSKNTSKKISALDKIMSEDIDLDHAAQFVVGKYWRQMSDEQKKRYIPLFKRYAHSLYKNYPLNINKGDITFEVNKVIIDKGIANIFCTIYISTLEQNVTESSKGGIKVSFIVTKKNNHLLLRDLKIEESSLLLSFRERFYKMIHEDSDDEIDWFLEDFEAMVEDNEYQNDQNLYIQ